MNAPVRQVLTFALFSYFGLQIYAAKECRAFEFSTHAAITREAASKWQAAPENMAALGLAPTSLLNSAYLDMAPGYLDISSGVRQRSSFPLSDATFGSRHFDAANATVLVKPLLASPAGWLMLGSIREDDVPFDSGSLENTPQDDPDGQITRVFNHFFDPYLDRALWLGTDLGVRAPDWAIVGKDKSGSRRNHFAVADAREAMWRALSLKQLPSAGQAQLSDVPYQPTNAIPNRMALRSAYWATTFRALGDTLHLLQDMAQPQHTRNDPHAGLGCSFGACAAGHASFFENYIDARVRRAPNFRLRERFFGNVVTSDVEIDVRYELIRFDGYPMPHFNRYGDFFTTAVGSDSLTGQGIANYSNRGFYSSGTNISAATPYPSPPRNDSSLRRVSLAPGTAVNAAGRPVTGALVLLQGSVSDSTYPQFSEANVALSTLSAFSAFTAGGRFNLNHYNYDDQARLLIPRAVAYSAGLLDFFFRGKLEISLPSAGFYSIVDHAKFSPPASATNPLTDFRGFGKVRLRLKNATDDIAPPGGSPVKQDMPRGLLVAVFKFNRNLCYTDNEDGEITSLAQASACRNKEEEIVVSDPLLDQAVPFGTAQLPDGPEITFNFSQQLPINAWNVVLQVIYRGKLGLEDDAVVVMTKDISEPTFVTVRNDTDYVAIGGTCYKPSAIAANDALWNSLAPICQDTAGGTRKVSAACTDVPLNLRFAGAGSNGPVTVSWDQTAGTDARLKPRRFGRFAVLGDVSASEHWTLAFNNAPLFIPGGNAQPWDISPYRSQVDGDQTGYVDTYTLRRGVKAWEASAFIVDGTTGATGSPCAENQLDALADVERSPMPISLSGW